MPENSNEPIVIADDTSTITSSDVVSDMLPDTASVVKKRLPRYPVFAELALVLSVLASVFFFPFLMLELQKSGLPASSSIKQRALPEIAEALAVATTDTTAFADIALLGRSVIVWDVARGEQLFAKNAGERLPLASVTKLMTALIAHEILPEGTRITIPAEYDLAEYSALVPNDVLSAKDLLDYTLLVSSNEGANIIAKASAKSAFGMGAGVSDFVRAMNVRAELLGLTQTTYNNPSGLDINASSSGAYGSAYDMAKLLEYILHEYPDVLSATVLPEKKIVGNGGFTYTAKNTNGVTSEIPGLIASKTGYETLAGGNLAVAFNAGLNRPIIVVVLGSTKNGRFDDILKLVEAARISVSQ